MSIGVSLYRIGNVHYAAITTHTKTDTQTLYEMLLSC
jgi:hypothetical protein